MSRRPEHSAPPEIFYDEREAKKYTDASRNMEIQHQMSERAVELLVLPENQPCLLLDIGCGSGLSGNVLEELGHMWIGVDISTAMLNVALENEVQGGLVLSDMGEGMPFRPGTFDGAISISALQWLCYSNKKSQNPVKRLNTFFSSLYACLSNSARAVFQFYPENDQQVDLITTQATKAGFFGGVVVDYPNSAKAKKYFLVLMTGGPAPLPKAKESEESNIASNNTRRDRFRPAKGKSVKDRNWVLEKKERRRRQGKNVREDTKYTARKRSGRF